jgi:hypothetical protein
MTDTIDDLLDGPAEPAGSRVPALEGRRLTVQEQAHALAKDTARAGWRRFRKACAEPGGFIHALMSEKPPSVTEQVAYAEGRRWVTAGHDGGIADVAGTAYHKLIGINGVAWHDAMAALYAKPFRLAVALVIFAVFSVPVVLALGWLPWLITTVFLRAAIFPLAVWALRPKGVTK